MDQKTIDALIKEWSSPPFDQETILETQNFIKKASKEELSEAFGKPLAFGTAGIRAKVGLGPGLMNKWTVAKATQGLANYLKRAASAPLSVVISYDPRLSSVEFAKECASVLAGNGIAVILSEKVRPTPWASFACRELKASAAVMITASHNPKEDNGYKVYWNDGAQVLPPHDHGIIDEVNGVKWDQILRAPKQSPLITHPEPSIDERFLAVMRSHFPKKAGQAPLRIAYSPLYGAGFELLPRLLATTGFSELFLVPGECEPNGHFPKYPYPNPELDSVMGGVCEVMAAQHCELGLASDPDSDRLRMACLHEGKPFLFTGNQMAALLTDYLLQESAHPKEKIVIASIVSSPLIGAITKSFGAKFIPVLTGFKYIGEKMRLLEEKGELDHFLVGSEESCGFLATPEIRDKDALSSALIFAEMAASLGALGLTLADRLFELYEKYGIYREGQTQVLLEKPDPMLLERLKERLSKEFSNLQDLSDPKVAESLGVPPTSMVAFSIEPSIHILIRPSGTEPKVKIYGQIGPLKNADMPMNRAIAKADLTLNEALSQVKGYFA